MQLLRYGLIALMASVAVSNGLDTFTQFDWDNLQLMLGFALMALAGLLNHTLIWPYEVAADYVSRMSNSKSKTLFSIGEVLVCLGIVIKVIQAFSA